MKRDPNRDGILNPAHRDARIKAIANYYNMDFEQEWAIRCALTPPKLLNVPMHAIRGKKSLTRIQQIENRRRYKRRAA